MYANVCFYVYAKLIYGLNLESGMGKKMVLIDYSVDAAVRELNDFNWLQAQ